MTRTIKLSKKSWIGVDMETTPGTAGVAPTLYVRAKDIPKAKQDAEYPKEEMNSRSENWDRIPTTRHSEAGPKGAFYFDTTPYYLIAAMGTDTPTQPNVGSAPTAWKHAISLADTIPSLTHWKSFGGAVKYYPYTCVEKFELSFEAEKKLLEFSCGLHALFPVNYTGATLTPTYSHYKALQGYLPTITVGGQVSTDVEMVKLTFDQKITYWYGANGSPDFVTAYPGERSIKVDFNARYDDTTIYDRYVSNTDDSLLIDFMGPNIASTVNNELNISLPLIGYDDGEHDDAKENVMVKMKATARPSLSNNELSIFVVNTVASYAS